MPLGKKKPSFGSSPKKEGGYAKKKANIKNIGGIWQGKHGMYVKISDYNGDLIFREKETGRYYQLGQLRLTEPYAEHEGLELEVSINLDNEKAAVLIEE